MTPAWNRVYVKHPWNHSEKNYIHVCLCTYSVASSCIVFDYPPHATRESTMLDPVTNFEVDKEYHDWLEIHPYTMFTQCLMLSFQTQSSAHPLVLSKVDAIILPPFPKVHNVSLLSHCDQAQPKAVHIETDQNEVKIFCTWEKSI